MTASSGKATRSQPAASARVVGVEDAVDVAVEVADDEIELRGRDAEPGHPLRIRDTARMPRAEARARVSPTLSAAIERSADATTARTVIERLVEAHPDLADELAANDLVRDGVVALACASRSLSSAVIADPGLLGPLRDPDAFRRERNRDDYAAAWSASGRRR